MEDERLLTTEEVAERLKVSPSFVHKLDSSGRLPQAVRLGRAKRWPLGELLRWLGAGCPRRDKWEQTKN